MLSADGTFQRISPQTEITSKNQKNKYKKLTHIIYVTNKLDSALITPLMSMSDP